MRLALRRLVSASGIAALALGASMTAARADEPTWTLDLPAGVACAGFDLRIEGWGSMNQQYREFLDADGKVVRSISAGTGMAFTYTNLSTGATMSSRSNGSTR